MENISTINYVEQKTDFVKEIYKNLKRTISNQRIQDFMDEAMSIYKEADVSVSSIRQDKMNKIQMKIKKITGLYYDEYFTPVERLVVNEIFYITTLQGVIKIEKKNLVKQVVNSKFAPKNDDGSPRIKNGARAVTNTIKKLQNLNLIFKGHLKNSLGRKGKYILADVEHPNFFNFLKATYGITQKEFKLLKETGFSEKSYLFSNFLDSLKKNNNAPHNATQNAPHNTDAKADIPKAQSLFSSVKHLKRSNHFGKDITNIYINKTAIYKVSNLNNKAEKIISVDDVHSSVRNHLKAHTGFYITNISKSLLNSLKPFKKAIYNSQVYVMPSDCNKQINSQITFEKLLAYFDEKQILLNEHSLLFSKLILNQNEPKLKAHAHYITELVHFKFDSSDIPNHRILSYAIASLEDTATALSNKRFQSSQQIKNTFAYYKKIFLRKLNGVVTNLDIHRAEINKRYEESKRMKPYSPAPFYNWLDED